MNDFLKWATNCGTPFWIEVSVIGAITFGGLAWFLVSLALAANGKLLEAAILFFGPLALLFREIWKEYRKFKAEGQS